MVVPIMMRTHVLHNIATHIISLQLYLRVPGTKIPSLLSLILYSQFNLDENFFFPAKDCLKYSFCSVGLGDFCSIHRGNEFCFKTICVLIFICTTYEIHPMKESWKGLKKNNTKAKKPLSCQRICVHKLLPGSYEKKVFLSWRRKSRCLIFQPVFIMSHEE